MVDILFGGLIAVVCLCIVIGIICLVALVFYRNKMRCPTCDALTLREHGHYFYCPMCGSYFMKDEHGILRQLTKF